MTGAVFHNTLDIIEVGRDWYEKLRRDAKDASNKQARLCLHRRTDEPIQEMIIVFHRDAVIRPHRHRGKVESYHHIFGELGIVLFDEGGRPTRLVSMGDFADDKTHLFRQEATVWHSVVVHSEYAALHEVTNGPFRPEEREFAPWAPRTEDELRAFLVKAVETLLQP